MKSIDDTLKNISSNNRKVGAFFWGLFKLKVNN